MTVEKNKIIDELEKKLEDLGEASACAALDGDAHDAHNAVVEYSEKTKELLKKLKTFN